MSQAVKSTHPAGATVCEIKVGDSWQTIGLDEAKRAREGSLLRCPACGGKVAVHGTYSAEGRIYMQHRRPHDGCPYLVKRYSGTPSRHPEALT